MASFLYVESRALNVSPDSYVTCSGTVRAPHGAAIVRKVVAYLDNDPTRVVGMTESTVPMATFSMQIQGLEGTEFTVVAKGERGENDEVVANCGVNVAGVPGQYIAPPLNNLTFIVGNDAVTSPYVDLSFPQFVVDAEVVTDYILDGDPQVPSLLVESYVINNVQIVGNINVPKMAVDALVDNITVVSADIRMPLPLVSAEGETVCDISGQIEMPRFSVDAETGSSTDVRFPDFVVEAEAITPAIITVALALQRMGLDAVSMTEVGISAGLSLPSLLVQAAAATAETIAADIRLPVLHVDGVIPGQIDISADIEFPSFDVFCDIPQISDEIISFAPRCGR